MFVTIDELTTHLYDEQMQAISGDDQTILTAAIDGAVAEAKSYLNRFDKDAIFNATGSSRHALLVIFIKDIAVWHYINLANPGADFKIRENRYNAAIAWLKLVQKGEAVPDLPEPTGEDNPGGTYDWGSNTKRDNHI